MRRFLSFILILFLITPAGVGYLGLILRQHQIRKEVRLTLLKGIPEEDLVLLKFSFHDLQSPSQDFKKIHEDEFVYYGEMYDIVREEQRGDEVWYWCVRDHKETCVLTQMKALVKKAMDQDPYSKKQSRQLLQFFANLFCTDDDDQISNYPLKSDLLYHYTFSIVTWNLSPLSPPPKA